MTILDKVQDEPIHKKKKVKKKKTVNKKTEKNNNENKKTSKNQHILFYKILSFILIILTIINIGSIIVKEIFSFFYMLPIILISAIIIFGITLVLNKNNLRLWIKNILSFLAILIIIFDLLMLFFGTSTLKFLTTITDTGYRVETFGVYVLDNKYNNIESLKDTKITYLNHGDTQNVNKALDQLKKEISFEEVCVEHLSDLLSSLENDSSAIILETSYEAIIKEEYEELFENLKLIKKIDVVSIVKTMESDTDITKEPFVVYISGIDTSGNIASRARSDVNILLAVNPKTNNILMINTPRDFYVTFHTKGKKDKLTHAGIYGPEESLMTLEDLYDIDIDYYVRVNFTSFMNIVDALDGITVDVPKYFCESDSSRNKKNQICLNKGVQKLNGKQALALARHRKTIGDRKRGENQMLVLKAIINKAISPKILTNYSKLINSLEGKVVTNMQIKEMFDFVQKQLKDNSNWNIYNMSANGSDSSNYCEVIGSGKAYVMEPNIETIDEIKEVLKRLFDGENEILINKES